MAGPAAAPPDVSESAAADPMQTLRGELSQQRAEREHGIALSAEAKAERERARDEERRRARGRERNEGASA